MIISINQSIVDKPSDDFKFPYDGWVNYDLNIDEIFSVVTELGYATSCELDGSGIRGSNRFVSRQLFMVDVDYGYTLDELKNSSFYQKYSCGFYTSSSHKPDAHRFRILFQTETPLYDAYFVKMLTQALIREFNGDTQCKDPARLFYGNSQCVDKQLKEDIFLPDELIAKMISEEIERDKVKKVLVEYIESEPLSNENKSHMLKLLSGLDLRYSGSYEKWRNIGFAMKREGFALHDFVWLSSRITNTKTEEKCSQLWRSAAPEGGITWGTVIAYLREIYTDEQIFKYKLTKEEYAAEQFKKELYQKYGEKLWQN